MSKKINFLFLFLFLLVSTISAQQTIPEQIQSYQYNTEFELKRTCFDDGKFCDSSYICNITLLSPSGQDMINNQLMTNNGSYRSITVPFNVNNELGYANGIQSCDNTTFAGSDTFVIQITGNGKPYEKFPQEFVIVILAIIMIIIGMFHDQLRLIKYGGSIILFVMGVLTLYPGYSFINYSTLLGKVLGTTFIGIGFYFMINDSFSRNEQQEGYDQTPEVEDLYD